MFSNCETPPPGEPIWGRLLILTSKAVVSSVSITVLVTESWFYLANIEFITQTAFLAFAICISAFVPGVVAPLLAVGIMETHRKLALARDELARIAHVDLLTGLPNRRGFDVDAEAALAAARSAGQPVAALMCDIDHFKTINDRFGHDFGDEALVQIAATIRETLVGRSHVACRQGGEEFAVILPGCDTSEARKYAEMLRVACAIRPILAAGQAALISVSIGVAGGQGNDLQLRALMRAADVALYKAKDAGRNCVVVAEAEAEMSGPGPERLKKVSG